MLAEIIFACLIFVQSLIEYRCIHFAIYRHDESHLVNVNRIQ